MGINIKTINKNYIPEITEPLGKYWNAPDRSEITVDDTHAIMSQKAFDKLLNYSHSTPTGAYEGKMWKGQYREGGWHLAWYGLSTDPNKVSNNTRKILIID